ncbi:MAG: sensor histidine kinase [Bacteroidia bacterium]
MGRALLYHLLLPVFLPLSWTASAQNIADSLQKAYLQAVEPVQKADIFYELAQKKIESDLELAPALADSLDAMASAAGYQKGILRADMIRALYFQDKSKPDTAIFIFRKILPGFSRLPDTPSVVRIYNNIARNFSTLYQPDSAIHYYLTALAWVEKTGNEAEIAAVYSNIGNLYINQITFEKGIEYLQKALKIREKSGDESRMIYTYNNISVAYGNQHRPDTAMYYADKGVKLAEKLGNTYVAGVLKGGMSNLLNQLGRYSESIEIADQSIADLRAVNRVPNLVFPMANKAKALNMLGKYNQGLQVCQEGYAIMKETGQLNPLEVYYENFALSYEGLGNFKEANYWWKKFMTLDDSIFQEENIRTLADMETRYQTQKKETQITAQKLQLESQQNRLLRQKIWIGGLTGGLILIFLGSWFLYHRYRLRQQRILDQALIREQKLGIQAVIEAQESERKRIARDLHDGIAQNLVALNLQLRVVEFSVEKSAPELAPKITPLTRQLQDTCEEVRNLAHLMLPPVLESRGLPGSLELLLKNSLTSRGLDARMDCSLHERPDPKIELGMYRIAQELINNILKHAHATRVSLRLFVENKFLILVIEDDGRGFDFEQARKMGSMGILNILSRVSNLSGEFSSIIRQPQGTISTITIPLSL